MSDNPFKTHELDGLDLTGKYRNDWVEEAIDFEEGVPHLTTAHTKNYMGTSVSSTRIKTFLVVVLLGIGIIFGRVFYLQVIKGEWYHGLAEGNRIRLQPVPSERGIIYDRFNKVLVQNIPGFSLTISPQDLPRSAEDKEKVLQKIGEMSGVDVGEIKKLLEKYGRYSETILIKENLDYDTALKLYIQNADLPGARIESGSQRNYVSSNATSTVLSLSHLLGYMGKLTEEELDNLRSSGYLLADKIGRTGLEKTYEGQLRGTYGRKKIEVNALGREQNVLAVEAPIPGKNLVLSLDLEAQRLLEERVKATAEATHKRKIAAIALDPRNGEIIAMVSWPAFDNNRFSHGIDQATYNAYLNDKDLPLFNRAVSGGYPPGSTAKLMVAVAALQEKIVTRTTSFLSVGGMTVGGTMFKDWLAGGHGITNVTKALAWSVNTFFYYVGGGYEKFVGLGVEKIVEYMKKFSVAQKTGIDLPGENAGFAPSKEWKKQTKGESWFVGDTYNLSIGQGDLLVTPLQVALWTAVVANNGTVVTPHLGKTLVDSIGEEERQLQYNNHKITDISSENFALVREGMRDCVTMGSCKMLQTLSFASGGKTGTAQWNNNYPTHAWFTSFAPLKNPQIVVTVLVEEGGQGSTVAMPIARDFLAWWGKKYLK